MSAIKCFPKERKITDFINNHDHWIWVNENYITCITFEKFGRMKLHVTSISKKAKKGMVAVRWTMDKLSNRAYFKIEICIAKCSGRNLNKWWIYNCLWPTLDIVTCRNWFLPVTHMILLNSDRWPAAILCATKCSSGHVEQLYLL